MRHRDVDLAPRCAVIERHIVEPDAMNRRFGSGCVAVEGEFTITHGGWSITREIEMKKANKPNAKLRLWTETIRKLDAKQLAAVDGGFEEFVLGAAGAS